MVQDMRLIELKGISKSFDGTEALSDVNLYIRKCEFITLLGPSGCGKTTMLRIIGGFEFPTTGQVMFEGKDITRVPPYRRRVNTVFQKYALFPHMNVFDNVAFGLTLKDANEIVPESRKPRNFVDGWLLKMHHRHALKKEIAKAKEIAGGAGLVAINAMVATQNYADAVRTAVEAGVDAIVSGAGLPLELPGLVEKADVALAPIVSSGRAAKLILRRWAKAFDRTADFVVIEGCKAGGHLGFSEEELLAGKCQTLDEILPEVLAEVKPFEAQFGHDIPVFVAGGVYTGEDIAHYTKMGAAGAQLATRFIPTYECDASQTYKDVLLAAKPEDVRIIHSPVGMPGRALATPLVQKLEQGLRFPPKHCARCLKACEPAKVPYCITHALIEAVKGNVEEGLFFCGANVGRLDRMRSVRELMDELMDDWRKHQ